jgi:soluble lytic murein transglycosylase-like protein
MDPRRISSGLWLALAWLSWPASQARADFYECRGNDGRRWITNYKQPDAKCHLKMKTEAGLPAAAKNPGGGVSSYAPPLLKEGNAGERAKLYQPYVEDAAERYRLPPALIRAVMRVESNFQFRAVSSAGAQGLMQLMPGTASEMGVSDPWDPQQNIQGGARLLRVLANRHQGDLVKVLSAYHAGSGAVKEKGGIPYEQTESYVRAVLDHYYQYRALDGEEE